MLAVMGYSADRDMARSLKPNVIKSASNIRARPAKSQPVDAQELSRRLCMVLAQQKMQARRKRYGEAGSSFTLGQIKLSSKKRTIAEDTSSKRVKSAKQKNMSSTPEAACLQDTASSARDKPKTTIFNASSPDGMKENISSSYHHVPQYAASQFVLTTNIESARKGPIHKLSKAAMRFHLEGPNANQLAGAISSEASPIEQAKAIRRAHDMRERQYERNQNHEPSLGPSNELGECDKKLLHRHTLRAQSGLAREETCNPKEARRRMSTGSLLRRADSQSEDAFELAIALFSSAKPPAIGDPDEHRVDWTQSDEMAAATATNLSHLSQLSHTELRNPDSRWSLRGRLGSFGRTTKDDKSTSPTTENATEELSSKTHIFGFFSRFKR